MIYKSGFLVATLVGVLAPAEASDPGVAEGSARYPASITGEFGGKPVRMTLTGTAMRTHWGMKIHSIGSYIQEKAAVRDAAGLAAAAVPKQLVLGFERDVDGAMLASSFRDAVAMNHPAPAFAAEMATLARYLEASPVRRGGRIWLSSDPVAGLKCRVDGHPEIAIGSVGFARAVWDVYLGPRNLGVAIRSGLTSRL